jgi:hypothetical protein
MTLGVEEARARRVCRVCEKPIAWGGPVGWPFEFRSLVYPEQVTLDFGDEFAHAACLVTVEANPAPSVPDQREAT